MDKAVFFAGSFDPFTIGHKDIVERALTMFHKVVVGVGENNGKQALMSTTQRVDTIKQAFAKEKRVEVVAYTGLTAEAARKYGCMALLRSVRGSADMDYERAIAEANRREFGLETTLLFARPELAHISSSLVRELQHYGHDTHHMLP